LGTPHQLPDDVSLFTARAEEIAELDAFLHEATAISNVADALREAGKPAEAVALADVD
jgi:hypothetical protein